MSEIINETDVADEEVKAIDIPTEERAVEIGRASCRERV